MQIIDGGILLDDTERNASPDLCADSCALEAWDLQRTGSTLRCAQRRDPSVPTAILAAWNQDPSIESPGNPVFNGADPDVLIANKNYWVYPTNDGETDALFVHSSPDLKNWKVSGPILKMSDISWISNDGAKYHALWAPGIVSENGKYYLYYSVGPQDPTPSRIGVAVSDAPDGKFKDIGKPLVTGGNGWEAIDPMVFKDPKSGDHFLYCGGSAGSKLHVYRLNADMTSIEKEIPVETPKNFTEGPFMHYRDGTYYLSYSHGQWDKSNYSVNYATSTSPTGPWNFKGTILKSDEKHYGPGHHAFLQNPSTGDWYVAYHRWNNAGRSGKMPPSRSVCIDKLDYDQNGKILPIKMTDTGISN